MKAEGEEKYSDSGLSLFFLSLSLFSHSVFQRMRITMSARKGTVQTSLSLTLMHNWVVLMTDRRKIRRKRKQPGRGKRSNRRADQPRSKKMYYRHTFLKFCEFGMISRMGKRSVLPRIPMPLRKHWHHTFCGCKTTGQCWRNRTRLLPLVKLPNWLVKNGSSWVMMRNLLVDLQRHQHFVLYYCDLSLK